MGRQIHGPVHGIVWPAHIEPVSHGPRRDFRKMMGRAETFEKVMDRAGPGFFFNVMGWAGPRPIL